jgi:transposase-like protein
MAMRKKHEPAIKARVALQAIKGEKTVAQISSEYGVHPTQVTQWKQELIQRSAEVFAKPDNTMAMQHEEMTDKLHKTIGEITMENNWLKKKLRILS